MASQWLLNYINTPEGTSSPAPAPVAKTTLPSPTPPQVAPPPASKPPVNTHGQLFSGGIVSKLMDALRLPEYALSSFAKGASDKATQYQAQARKTNQTGFQKYGLGGLADTAMSGVNNIIPGVMSRTQLGREPGDYNMGKNLGVQNPAAQTAINFGTSLALPTLPLGKVASVTGKVISKAPGAGKVAEVASKAGTVVSDYAKATPTIYNALEKVPGLEHFRNPEAGKILTDASNAATVRISSLYNKINDVAKGLTPAERVKISQIIEGGVVTKATPIRLVQRANYIKGISDEIGKELVQNGIMSQQSFDKFGGKYLSHIADVVKNTESNAPSGAKGMLSFTSDALKQRKGVLGSGGQPDYIRQFQYPTFKALAGEIQNIESVKAIKKIANNYGIGAETFNKTLSGPRVSDTGMVALKDILPNSVGKHVGDLGVPPEVADYITRKYAKSNPNILNKVADSALNAWKLGKTIYSGPAYHTRNLMSNQILSDYATGAGLPATLLGYGRAVKAYLGKGDAKMNQYLAELKDAGVINRVNIGEGVQNLKPSVFGQDTGVVKKFVKDPFFAKNFQKASEETAKLNVFAHFRNQGMSVKDAAAKAEEAIFSPYKISQTERGLVKGAIPFYSFTRQAVPLVGKTALNRGGTLTKYEKAKTAVEGLSPEGAGQKPPTSGQVRLPMKDKNGQYIYGDPTYILPHGNFDAGGNVQKPSVAGTLLGTGSQGPFGLGWNPLATEVASQLFNKDLYFNQTIGKSNIPARNFAQRVQHGFQTFAPNLMPTDFVGGIPSTAVGKIPGLPDWAKGSPGINYETRGGSKIYNSGLGFDPTTGNWVKPQGDYAGRTRSRVQAILDTFGLKSSSVSPDQPKFDAGAKSKALKDISTEMVSIRKDQRLKPQEKVQLIQDLLKARQQVLQN